MTRRHRIFTTALTLWLATISFSSVAKLPDRDYWRWFEVEVLLFRHTADQQLQEQFPLAVERIATEAGTPLLQQYYEHTHRALRAGLPACESQSNEVVKLNLDIACQFADEDQWIPIPGSPFAAADPLAELATTKTVISGSGGDINSARQPFIVSSDHHVLTETRTELQRKGLAEPLLHVAWRQPVFKEQQQFAMHLFAGKQYTKEFRYDGFLREPDYALPPASDADEVSTEQAMAARMNKVERLLAAIDKGAAPFAVNTDVPLQAPAYSPTPADKVSHLDNAERVWQLDGLLHIFLIGNYLHIDGDFNLRQPEVIKIPLADLKQQAENALRTLQNQPGQTFLRAYPFAQRRRVISHETHYFDHPYLGMVVQIRRTDLSAPRY